jgi:hypothetical protein
VTNNTQLLQELNQQPTTQAVTEFDIFKPQVNIEDFFLLFFG